MNWKKDGRVCMLISKHVFHPSQYVEWHCGNAFANDHYIGIERCQSKINGY